MLSDVHTEYLVYAIAISSKALGGKIRRNYSDYEIFDEAFTFFQYLVGSGEEITKNDLNLFLSDKEKEVPGLGKDLKEFIPKWLDDLNSIVSVSDKRDEEFFDAIAELADLKEIIYLSELEILVRKKDVFTDEQRKFLIALGIAFIGVAIGGVKFLDKLFTLLRLSDIKRSILYGDDEALSFYKSMGLSLEVLDTITIKMISAAGGIVQALEREDLEGAKRRKKKKATDDERIKAYSEEEVNDIIRLNMLSK